MKQGMALAAIAAVLLLASAHQVAASGRSLQTTCAIPSCPSGYTVVKDGTTACGYECWTAAKLNCPSGPLQQARVCGGTSNKICPSISCAYSSTYAVSGPTGCASAQATISALATSTTNTTINTAGLSSQIMKSYCASDPSATSMPAAASNAALAYASTIAKVYTQYNTYVCSCCTGNTQATAVVGSNAQAVAIAQANSTQSILGQLNTCFDGQPALLAAAYAYSTAFARDVQLAIYGVAKNATKVTSAGGKNCSASGMVTDMTNAVASATACTFANIYAAAIDAVTPGITYACASSVAISGIPGVTSCPININCPCTPSGYQYNNLGFEQGTFDVGDGTSAPAWYAQDSGDAMPRVVMNATITDNAGKQTLITPEEGNYLAVIPAPTHPKGINTNPTSPSLISATITVPPCANQISLAYIFKCGNNQMSSNGDQSTITIQITDIFNSTNVMTTTITPSCLATGNGAATNGGKWTDVTIPIAYGEYQVVVMAESTSGQDQTATYSSDDDGQDDEIVVHPGDAGKPPALYLDNISFSSGGQQLATAGK